MKLSLAKIISLVFHPMVVLTLTPFLLVLRTTHSLQAASYWTAYSLVFIILFILFPVIAVKKKIFSDLDVSKREQRPLVYKFGILVGFAYIVSSSLLKAPIILYFGVVGVMLGVAVFALINRRIKASVHVAAATALIFPLSISYGKYYYLLLFLIPLIVWARIKTKRHTFSEILVGGSVGGFLSLSFYYIARFFLNK